MIRDLPEWAGFGNQLFFYLRAHSQRKRGVDYHLVRGPRSGFWLERFPELSALTISRREASLRDARDTSTWHQVSSVNTPSAATFADIQEFIERYLVPSEILAVDPALSTGITINVRRGDYFSDPRIRGLFSFDQLAYIGVVLDRVRQPRIKHPEIRVVSDDLDWCRQRMQHLRQETDTLVFLESDDPVHDLRTVACSREVIIMNSSFSIWAAYISNYLYADNHSQVHAPAFGTRPFDGQHWSSLDPRWDIIPDIPGGWDS